MTLPTVEPELLERIAALAAEAEALLPVARDLGERARATRAEYHARLDDLRIDEAVHLSGDRIHWAARDVASERDGLDRLSDAIWELRQVLEMVSDHELRF